VHARKTEAIAQCRPTHQPLATPEGWISMADSRQDGTLRITSLAGWRAGRILDLRTAADFAALHLRGAVSHPVVQGADPATAVPSIFLPPREQPLLVITDDDATARRAAEDFAGRGRGKVDGLGLTASDLGHLPSGMVEQGACSGRLWEPPAWLRCYEDLLPPPALGPVVDLGCGSGRAAVWLARRGYAVTGFDHQPEALALGARLAASEDCRCDFRQADLRHTDQWPTGSWGVLMAHRYLQRDLLSAMAGALVPGGVAVVRTFREAPGYMGHPSPRHRLAPRELARFFARNRFEILAYAEDFDPDGRPAAGIMARRY